jgi:hypothetical protein
MIQTLINSNKYDGKFVAFKDFDDHSIVGEGMSPKDAYDMALSKGYKNPVVTFVPIKDMVQIY